MSESAAKTTSTSVNKEGGVFLMDKGWEEVQKKTFTKWSNMHLRRGGKALLEVATIKDEFQTGVNLMNLIHVLYQVEYPKHSAAPKLRVNKIDNCALALRMVKDAGVKTNFLGPENLVDCDQKMVLGMLWSIILDYAIKGISEEQLSAREGLLLWCQKKTAGYRDVKVENFSSSWTTGMALCALIHRHRPELIPYDSLDKANAKQNVELAFDVAEKHLNIPRLLDVEDLTDTPRPDEKSVMTYIAEFFHVFASQDQKEKSAARVKKFIEFQRSVEDMQNDYEAQARKLLSWIDAKIAELGDRSFNDSFSDGQALVQALKEYKTNEKSKAAGERVEVEGTFNNVQTKRRANGRALYQPPAGLAPADIDAAWDRLGQAEKERGEALRENLRRLRENMRVEFAKLANEFYSFLDGTKQAVTASSNDDLQAQLDLLRAKARELEDNSRLHQIEAANKRLEDAGVDDNPHTNHTIDELQLLNEQLKALIKKRAQFVEAQQLAANNKGGGLTAEQLAEIKETFKHFDKDGNDHLDKLEFKACISAIGIAFADDSSYSSLFSELDDNGNGVPFQKFVEYMVKINEDTDTADQIKRSFRSLADDRDSFTAQTVRPFFVDAELDWLKKTLPADGESLTYGPYVDSSFAPSA